MEQVVVKIGAGGRFVILSELFSRDASSETLSTELGTHETIETDTVFGCLDDQ